MKRNEEIEARIAEYLRQWQSILDLVPYRIGKTAVPCDPKMWNRKQREREIAKLEMRIAELRWVIS